VGRNKLPSTKNPLLSLEQVQQGLGGGSKQSWLLRIATSFTRGYLSGFEGIPNHGSHDFDLPLFLTLSFPLFFQITMVTDQKSSMSGVD
jgi:hypothetical protein